MRSWRFKLNRRTTFSMPTCDPPGLPPKMDGYNRTRLPHRLFDDLAEAVEVRVTGDDVDV